MGNRPNTTQREAMKASQQTPSNTSRVAEASFRFLLFMTQRHPILFWTGSWLSMVLVSWLAIAALTYTNPAPLEIAESPQPEAVAPSPEAEPQFRPSRPTNSLGLLAAVAVSCAATTALLAHQLRPVKPAPKRAIKRIPESKVVTRSTAIRTERTPRKPVQTINASELGNVDRASKPAASTPKPPKVPVAAAQPAAKTPIRTAKPPISKPVSQPKVTVIPVEESHPLDWGDANLADMMDIRRRESISFEV